ncbi:MAG: multidrug resistance protein [Paenibacillaceae bacterium]|nr:multidrug resistance protein [Paenibacillaceae bacterium]
MNKTWTMVVAAALFEVAWVIGLKHADSLPEWSGTLVAICLSFYFMMNAARQLPVGTVYAVFVGLGTAGTVIAESLLFEADISAAKVALLTVLLAGVMGLKLLSAKKEEAGGV